MVKLIIWLLIVCAAGIFLLNKWLNKGIEKGMEYENLALKIFDSLKRENPDISLETARKIIHGALDEKWFLSLREDQRTEVKDLIEGYMDRSHKVNELELNNLVSSFREKTGY